MGYKMKGSTFFGKKVPISSPLPLRLNTSPLEQHENPSDKEKETPGQYWYKINGKDTTKEQYLNYKNNPASDEPGKQTNDPNISLAKKSANKRKNK